MSIEFRQGDLLGIQADALVNPVNTVGVMGKGLALQFKQAFPSSFRAYVRACKAGQVVVGRMHVVQRCTPPWWIINFPTKKHWLHASRIEYIRDGLKDLVIQIRRFGIKSIAIPPLGCGLGGLSWDDVKPLILEAVDAIQDCRIILLEPSRG